MNFSPKPVHFSHPAIRTATREDVPAILELIHELAVYEKEPDAVLTTAADLEAHLFSDSPHVWCHVAEAPAESGHRIDGIALWFLTYSTWEGRHGIHLEDLVVRESARGNGLGQALMCSVAQVAVENGYKRLEWQCLNWNEPAIGFYRALGAAPMDEWTTFRLDGDALARVGTDSWGGAA